MQEEVVVVAMVVGNEAGQGCWRALLPVVVVVVSFHYLVVCVFSKEWKKRCDHDDGPN